MLKDKMRKSETDFVAENRDLLNKDGPDGTSSSGDSSDHEDIAGICLMAGSASELDSDDLAVTILYPPFRLFLW